MGRRSGCIVCPVVLPRLRVAVTIVEHQIELWRHVSQSAQEARGLPPVVGAMVHHMQHQLPKRLAPGIAAHVLIRNFFQNRIIGEPGCPLPPAFMESGPIVLQH